MKYSIVFTGALALSTALAAPSPSPSPVFLSDDKTSTFANSTETSFFNTTDLTNSEIASVLNATNASSNPFINLKKKYKFGNYDGLPWSKASDAAERAFTHLCPEEHDNGRSCIGEYVNNGRYRLHFDRDLNTCMKTLTKKCNQWDAKNKYCAIRTIDHVKLTKNGKGELREMFLHAKYTGKGKPKYWWKRSEDEVGHDGEEAGEAGKAGQKAEGGKEDEEAFSEESGDVGGDNQEDSKDEVEKSDVEKSDVEEKPSVSSPSTEDVDVREIEKLTKMLEKLRQQFGDDGEMALGELLEALNTAS